MPVGDGFADGVAGFGHLASFQWLPA